MIAPPRRRWLRFSLRTLFVLVTVLGVFLGWLTVQVKWIRDRSEAAKWVFPNGGNRLQFSEPETTAPWGIRILGEPGYKEVYVWVNDRERPTADDQRVKRQVETLFPEAEVGFTEPMHGMTSFSGFR